MPPNTDPQRDTAQAIKAAWPAAYAILQTNWSAASSYMTGLTLDEVDEFIDLIAGRFARLRAPAGNNASFQLARSLGAHSLREVLTHVEAIKAGQIDRSRALLASLVQCAAALHSQFTFGTRESTEAAIADLSADTAATLQRLTEATVALDTATTKARAAEHTLDAIDDGHLEMKTWLETAQQRAAAIEQHAAKAESAAQSSAASQEEVVEAVNRLEQHAIDGTEALERLADAEKQFKTLKDATEAQQSLITDLLPSATSAGLASAFEARAIQHGRSKDLWAKAFLGTVAILFLLALVARENLINATAPEISLYLLARLPFSAPVIWFAWFSALQYGQHFRLEEDYAFKAATSKAFAGYRDHLEHLKSIDTGAGEKAMDLMAARTIEVLAREPHRIFGRSDADATPAVSLLDRIRGVNARQDEK